MLIMNSLSKLRKVVTPIAVKHRVIHLYLFRSRARGDKSHNGNYDFCVAVPVDCNLMNLGSLMCHLADVLGAKVDLICENNLPHRLSLMEEMLHDRKTFFDI